MDLSPEFRLFCLAVRPSPSPDDLTAMRLKLAARPDWDSVMAGARRHLLGPFVLSGLRACGAAQVPSEVLAELRGGAQRTARRSLDQMAEIGRLSRIFAAVGIRVMVIKGVALSAQLYGDPGRRGGRDIDLIVDPHRLIEADAIIAEAGYRRSTGKLSPRQSTEYRRRIKDNEYTHAVTGMPLELHHRLTDNADLLAWDFDDLWDEREELHLGDTTIATLSRRRQPLYLCAHGGVHGWERLLWLVDLAVLLAEPADADAAVAAADAAGLGSAMLHVILLAHDWLGLRVAERHIARARNNTRVAILHRILAHLYAGAAWHQTPSRTSWIGMLRYSLWARLYRLLLKSGWRYLATQVSREWFTPADWHVVRLPDTLFWLYPFVRPAGWLLRRWRR
jgi:Uncharacterised nucleotidyltransferase